MIRRPSIAGAPNRSRALPACVGFAVFTLTLVAPISAYGQTDPATMEAHIREVVEQSQLRSVVSDMGGGFMAAVEEHRTSLTDSVRLEIQEAVSVHFSADSLFESVVHSMLDAAEDDRVFELRDWTSADEHRTFRQAVDESETTESLEAYSQRLSTEPPSDDRIAAVSQLVAAQRTGSLYVLIEEAFRQTAHEAVTSAGVMLSPLEERTDRELESMAQQYEMISILTYMQRTEALSEEQIRAAAVRYETPSGEWYVRAYSEGLFGAVRDAGLRVAERIREGG